MIKKNIFRALLIVSSLAFLYACNSPLSPNEALKKYAGSWISDKSGNEVFSIDSDGNISSSSYTGGELTQESDTKFVVKNAESGRGSNVVKATVTYTFESDTKGVMTIEAGDYNHPIPVTKKVN